MTDPTIDLTGTPDTTSAEHVEYTEPAPVIEVEPDHDGPDQLDFTGYASPAAVAWQPATVGTELTRTTSGGSHVSWRATKTARETRGNARDGGNLHVITAAARTPGVGLVAGYEGADPPLVGHGNYAVPKPGEGLLADGMAIRVVTRLDRHEVHVPGATTGDDEMRDNLRPFTVGLRYLPAAAVTNPRAQLGIVLPDGWNPIVGAGAGFTTSGLEYEVNALEAIGLKIRHRLYIHATPSSMGVHFGTMAERIDLYAAARDVLRAGGMVQIEAGAMTALDAVAAVGLPPWAGYVARFDMTIVVPCSWTANAGGILSDATSGISVPVPASPDTAQLARDAVHRAGGPAVANNGWTGGMGLALVDVHKIEPGVAGWTNEQYGMAVEAEASWSGTDNGSPATVELGALIKAVQDTCDGEVDVELVGTGPGTVIDLR